MRFVFAVLLLFIGALPAASDPFARQRLELASSQQMLAQRVARSVCFLAADVDTDNQLALLEQSMTRFEAQMKLLREGNPEAALPAETDPTMLKMLETVDGVWSMMRGKIEAAENTYTAKVVAQTAVQSLSLLSQFDGLNKAYGEQIAQDRPNGSDLIDMLMAAGAQRVLIERGSREACMSYLDINGGMIRPQMQSTVKSFATGCFALAFSSEVTGLSAPPTDAIQYENFQSFQEWSGLEWVFRSAGLGTAERADLLELGQSAVWLSENFTSAIHSYGALIDAS